jgi:hypothetical protein
MGVASAFPKAGEAAVAGALAVSLGYSIFASHRRRHASHDSPRRTTEAIVGERFERSGEPAGVR